MYRAIDADGNLVDSMVSEKRNMEAAQQFFKQALAVVGHAPEQVTTDGHAYYPRAVREILGDNVQHRTNKYLNNRLEQDHRGIKQRYYPMHGFGSFDSATRFCSAFDELRNYLRPRSAMRETASLSEQRRASQFSVLTLPFISFNCKKYSSPKTSPATMVIVFMSTVHAENFSFP